MLNEYTPEILHRFWSKIDQSDEPNGCWLWLGPFAMNGYGMLTIRSKRLPGSHYRLAHRASWEINVGPIPDGLMVCHNCPGGDTKHCVNPAHLWLGTAADNNADASRKGQRQTGDAHWQRRLRRPNHLAVLGEADVRAIKALLLTKRFTQTEIGGWFGVHKATINHIAAGRNWTHVV